MNRGLFITFEGIDGCGKSTQVKQVAALLEKNGVPFKLTREPGGVPIAEKIRELILSNDNSAMVDSCELLLYLAARAQHVEELIKPALENGITVLCDRFQEATIAYQGAGRGIDPEQIMSLNKYATGGLVPDLTVVFDVSVECAFNRMEKMGRTKDRMESASRLFFENIREGYLALASQDPKRIRVLDGEKSIEELSIEVATLISEVTGS